MTKGTDNTVGGNVTYPRQLFMEAYDVLPPDMRRFLANAVDNWSTVELVKEVYQGMGPEYAFRVLRHWENHERKEREFQARKAIGPYKGLLPRS